MAQTPSVPNCEQHKEECVLFCKTCSIVICLKCVIDPNQHQGHKHESLEMGMKTLRLCALEKIDKLKSKVTEYKNAIQNIKDCESKFEGEEKNTVLNVSKRSESLRKELDNINDKMTSVCRDIIKRRKKILSEKCHEFEAKLESLQQLLESVESESKSAVQSLPNLSTLLKPIILPEFLNYSSSKIALSIHPISTADWFGKLKLDGMYKEFVDSSAEMQSVVKYETEETKNIERSSDCLEDHNTKEEKFEQPIYEVYDSPILERAFTRLDLGDDNSVWMAVSGTREIRQIKDDNQNITRQVIIADFDLFDFAVTTDGNLMVTEMRGQRVQRHSIKKKRWHSFANFAVPYITNGICVARSEDIFVCLQYGNCGGKIVKLSKTGIQLFKVAFDENYEQMFNLPQLIRQSPENGDIFVVDNSSRIIVMNKQGKLRYRIVYDPSIEIPVGQDKNEFVCVPGGLAINSKGNLLISDFKNGKIYIYDCNGDFLRVLVNNVRQASGIVPTSDERLWISYDEGIGIRYTEGL